MNLPAHVHAERVREAESRREPLAECAITPSSGYEDAVRVTTDPTTSQTARLRDEASHIRKCLQQGTIGQSPLTDVHRKAAVDAGLALLTDAHWMARASGAKILQAADAANLATAVAVDRADRLDAGTATDRVELGTMRMPGVRTLEGVTYRDRVVDEPAHPPRIEREGGPA